MSVQSALTGVTYHPLVFFVLIVQALVSFLWRVPWRVELAMIMLHLGVLVRSIRSSI